MRLALRGRGRKVLAVGVRQVDLKALVALRNQSELSGIVTKLEWFTGLSQPGGDAPGKLLTTHGGRESIEESQVCLSRRMSRTTRPRVSS